MRLFVDPVIGELRVPEVQRKDIAALHHGLRNKPYQANRTLGVLSKMFSLAEVWGWRPDGSNPCRHVKRYKEHKRERFLSPEETERLGQVLREAEEEMPSAVAAFRLLLLTGCRMSEIRDLRWDYVKDDCIELPRYQDRRTGGATRSRGPALCCQPFLVRMTIPGSSRVASPALTSPICNAPGGASASRRALRACGSTICATPLPRARWLSGESLTMIGKLLGHTQVQTTARYAHLARDSIQTAAARITGSIGGNLLGGEEKNRALTRG